MNPDDQPHKTAPRCPFHRSPMEATGEQREGRNVFRCIVIRGRDRCTFEAERPADFVPVATNEADAEL